MEYLPVVRFTWHGLYSIPMHSTNTLHKTVYNMVEFPSSTFLCSAWKSSPKTAKRPQLDWTKTAKDWTCSLGLSDLRSQDCKKTGILYLHNNPSKHT
ncbi:uncharacterized protein LACBIDRAFT_319114 [Laccaria bicolor S238N-H82]|uniref:Predicted protein n=1 Tax=Laccaria bicolor (strain S238N-H82 / ATCC MYA-4686) TaxID=486041 RepID=B0D7X0_LACBS|nr:uncharacterized protein LACBIDRAFT_319114 [Laccaria bicolor S238N-H82]EDR09716.1 predicted protein [Laccaria bicolor S238N-H82]|eukprot:XP_001880065.1 predicted protein [Laccaria bicolor S238N-H82]